MLPVIRRAIMPLLLVASCSSGVEGHPTTVAEHDRLALHYEATADSIEVECLKARRHELTVDEPTACWKAQDLRFLEANRNAAIAHRAEAAKLRAAEVTASRSVTR